MLREYTQAHGSFYNRILVIWIKIFDRQGFRDENVFPYFQRRVFVGTMALSTSGVNHCVWKIAEE